MLSEQEWQNSVKEFFSGHIACGDGRSHSPPGPAAMAPKPKAKPTDIGAKGSGKHKQKGKSSGKGENYSAPSGSMMAGLAEVKRTTVAAKKVANAFDSTAKCQALLSSGKILPLQTLSNKASHFRLTATAEGVIVGYEEFQHESVYKTGKGEWRRLSAPSANYYDPQLVAVDAARSVEELMTTAERSITGDVSKYPRVGRYFVQAFFGSLKNRVLAISSSAGAKGWKSQLAAIEAAGHSWLFSAITTRAIDKDGKKSGKRLIDEDALAGFLSRELDKIQFLIPAGQVDPDDEQFDAKNIETWEDHLLVFPDEEEFAFNLGDTSELPALKEIDEHRAKGELASLRPKEGKKWPLFIKACLGDLLISEGGGYITSDKCLAIDFSADQHVAIYKGIYSLVKGSGVRAVAWLPVPLEVVEVFVTFTTSFFSTCKLLKKYHEKIILNPEHSHMVPECSYLGGAPGPAQTGNPSEAKRETAKPRVTGLPAWHNCMAQTRRRPSQSTSRRPFPTRATTTTSRSSRTSRPPLLARAPLSRKTRLLRPSVKHDHDALRDQTSSQSSSSKLFGNSRTDLDCLESSSMVCFRVNSSPTTGKEPSLYCWGKSHYRQGRETYDPSLCTHRSGRALPECS